MGATIHFETDSYRKGWAIRGKDGNVRVFINENGKIQIPAGVSIEADTGQHLTINTVSSDKTVRVNCRTYTAAASIVGLQTKPRAGVNQTNDVIGIESMPGMGITAITNSAGIVCYKAEPYIHSTAGAITGDVRCYEASVSKPTGAGTITGTLSCLKCVNNANPTVTGGVYCVHVVTGGDGLAWAGFALLPDDSAVSAISTSTALPTCAGWVRVKIGTTFVRLAGYNNS